MEKLKIKIRPTNDTGIFHNSRGDVEKITTVMVEMQKKIDELVDKVNELEKILEVEP